MSCKSGQNQRFRHKNGAKVDKLELCRFRPDFDMFWVKNMPKNQMHEKWMRENKTRAKISTLKVVVVLMNMIIHIQFKRSRI